MCGIAGVLNLREQTHPSENLLRRMLGQIRHRGPDQFGIYLGRGVALGNARLSIVDLGGGQQPIANEDRSLWVVFNGEIFNHIELRAELESAGHRFETHCDTEILLHAFEQWGSRFLERLNGQWAFAIWNELKRELFLARDRLGVRPVFYTETGGRFIFGSEIKTLFAVPEVARSIDPAGLDQVFTFWSAQAPRTCFAGVTELPPGCFLRAGAQGVQVERYWEADFGAGPVLRSLGGGGSLELGAGARPAGDVAAPRLRTPDSGLPHLAGTRASDESLVARFRELLTDAVRIRLRADVPVGAYLSGGLDSSVIAALIRDSGVSRLDTFSITFSDPQFDESEHQLRMARFLGTDHQVVHATHEQIGEVFPDVVWHGETALMRTSPAPMFLLSRLVRDRGYKVVLTGEGADEFLGGYDIFKEAKIRRFWAQQPESKWRWKLLHRLYPDIQGLGTAGASYLKSFFGAGLADTDDPFYSHAIRWKNTSRCRRFFSKDLLAALAAQSAVRQAQSPPGSGLRTPDSLSPLSSLPSSFGNWGPLERAQYTEITTFLSPYLLCSQGDRMGMANSVEGRFPFLDHRVVAFCNRLPARLKLRVLREKHLLREMAVKLIPPDVLARPKRPYRAPIQRSFFNAGCSAYVRELLSDASVAEAGLFDARAVGQLVKKADQGGSLGETDNMALVGVLSAQLLHQRFVSAWRPAPALSSHDDVKLVDRRG